MKIARREVQELEAFIERLENPQWRIAAMHRGDPLLDEMATRYFNERPHLLMPIGFDEYVAVHASDSRCAYTLPSDTERFSLFRRPRGDWWQLIYPPKNRASEFIFYTPSSWRREVADAESDLGEYGLQIPLEDLFSRLYSICDRWEDAPVTLWDSRLWTPKAQKSEKIILTENIQGVLTALKAEKVNLRQVSWQQLEEIVAEILRAAGMEIHIVRQRPQGGRDILARGVLIPGEEPLTIAIEVKHREVVDRPDLETVLWQNRMFPALLFVTSGRFTAGVYREKSGKENMLRLYLKDGVALGDMLKRYWR